MSIFPKAQTLLAVRDVLHSSKWYAELLDLQLLSNSKKDTHNNTYNRLLRNGEVVLQLLAGMMSSIQI